MDTITHYSGQVLANLQGPGGFMRCDFRLMQPELGHGAAAASARASLPTGTIINAQFPPRATATRRRTPRIAAGALLVAHRARWRRSCSRVQPGRRTRSTA